MTLVQPETILGAHVYLFAIVWRSPAVGVNANLVGRGASNVSP